ncbi:MAG: Type secretion system family protein [Patescibacteria group bacterium]|nr:Type secretion system family protein [Patescibacteria group bacterium]
MSLITFKYTARNTSTGKKVVAEVQADSVASAAKLISSQGLAPIEITAKDKVGVGLLSKLTNRVSTKDKILFSRQLATLINAGLPLVQSLRTVLGQTKNKTLKTVTSQIIADVESGSSLGSSLKKHPEIFNNIFTSLIDAGETSGTLDNSLDRLAFQQEKDAEVISKVRGALVYPIIVLLVMGGVVAFMLVSVLPQVEELYKGFGNVQLPILTRVLLAVSHAIIDYWWAVIIILIIATFVLANWIKTDAGRAFFDRLKMRIPAIGPLFMKLYMARFARTGTTLVASGVPLIRVLEITADAVDNVHVAGSIRGAIEKVKGGKSLADSLQDDPNFLDLVPSMLRIGEQSGQIEKMMEKTADYYEKEVDQQVKTISTIIEPFLMIVLGIVAITIVSAILVPIYGLVGQNIIK